MDFYDKTGNTSTPNQLKLRELPQSQITKVNMKYMYKQCIASRESITCTDGPVYIIHMLPCWLS